MKSEVIEPILGWLFRHGFEGIIAGVVAYFLLKYFLPGYFSEKGKNLATKEDIENITNKVESIKSEYAEILEEIRSNNQLKLAAIEREKSIKRAVFMEAAEAITKAQNMVASFSNLDLDAEEITKDFSAAAGKLAKVQIVGSGQTVKAVTTIMTSVGAATLSLMSGRQALVQRQNQIGVNEKQQEKSKSEVERYISIMKNLNLQGNRDQGLWDTINRSIDYENEQIDKYQKEIDSLSEVQLVEHIEYVRNCMDKSFKISALFPEAVLAVRKELDLEISPTEFLNIYNENLETGKAIFNDFLRNIKTS